MKSSLGLFLLLMIATRLGSTYFSPTGYRETPENYFGVQTLGHDLIDYGVLPWYAIHQGKTPLVFGYAAVLTAGLGVQTLTLVGICKEASMVTCGTYIYMCMIAFSAVGFVLLLFAFVRRKEDRHIAILMLGIFLLGVPAAKAFVSGNPDVFLSVFLGAILLLLRKRLKNAKPSFLVSIVLGILLGYFLNAKGFLILFVLAALLSAGPDIVLWLSMAASFAATSLWPWIFGVKSNLFSVFLFATESTRIDATTMLSQIHYGNIAVVPYVSNILHTIGSGNIPVNIHVLLTSLGTLILAAFIVGKPFFDEHIVGPMATPVRKTLALVRRSYSSYSFCLLLMTLSYIIALTATTWSYDYRIFYALPILFAFLGESRDRRTTKLLYLSIMFLLAKSLFIPKDRIMTVFLYLHFYFLLRAALSHWKSRLRVV